MHALRLYETVTGKPSSILDQRPGLYGDERLAYEAFVYLTNFRWVMDVPQRIQIDQILDYCRVHAIMRVDQVQDILYYIQCLDSVWFQWYGKSYSNARHKDDRRGTGEATASGPNPRGARRPVRRK